MNDVSTAHPLLRLSLIAMLTWLAASSARAADEERILLWPDGAPEAKGEEALDKPELIVYPAHPKTANGTAVVVCPGGGYRVLAIDHEGQQVARWLNRIGITAFVLKYRLKPKYEPKHALQDVRKALSIVRAKSVELKFNPQRVGILGFSAGGHLSSMSLLRRTDEPEDVERPNFGILIYPAYIYSNDDPALGTPVDPSPETPPIFIACTTKDSYVQGSIRLYDKLLEHGADAELHMFGGWGPHGLGMAPAEPAFGKWPELARTWLRKQSLLTDAAKHDVSGKIMVDGEPANRGWVRLTPVDDETLPIVATNIRGKDGAYSFAKHGGVCEGVYAVDVWLQATGFEADPTIEDAVRLTNEGAVRVSVRSGSDTFDLDLNWKE